MTLLSALNQRHKAALFLTLITCAIGLNAMTSRAQMQLPVTAPSPPPPPFPLPLPPKPSVIGSTFIVTAPEGTQSVHLYEEDGKLIAETKWRGQEDSFPQSVKCEKVNYVEIEADSFAPDAKKNILYVEDSDGNSLKVILRTEAEASSLAEYVARKSAVYLELIADAWRVRKPFQCPEGSQPGCQDFKELLDHDDREIAGYFYSAPWKLRNTYACFDSEERRFFVAQYTRPAHGKLGFFVLNLFKNGQSLDADVAKVDWSFREYGTIIKTEKSGQKPKELGSIDPSSLYYHRDFTNSLNTTTHYALDIRWSTDRYTEKYSSKDEKGEPIISDASGICIKLQ